MTIQDHEQFNTLERVVSNDFNDLQDISSRQLAESIKAQARLFSVDVPPSVSVRSHVCSGLDVAQNGGATIDVGIGFLAQQIASSPPSVPTPGALDSSYRFALNLTVSNQADPWDSTDAYWLLQARSEQVTALQETRDIYNPTTEVFAPSGAPIDKRYESQIAFSWKKGTSAALPSPDAGYAPIAGLYRPAGGGAIADSDIIQLATRFEDLSSFKSGSGANRRTKFRFATDEVFLSFSATAEFDFSGEVDGVKLFARTTAPITINDTPFLDPSDVALHGVANYWWYLYLSKADDQIPTNVYANIEHKGVLVASRVAPDDKGANSASIDVPDPIGGTVTAGNAINVGMFFAEGGTALRSEHVNDRGEGQFHAVKLMDLNAGNGYQDGISFDFSTTGTGGTEEIPYGVQWQCELKYDTIDNASVSLGYHFHWETSAAEDTIESQYLSTRGIMKAVFIDALINDMTRVVRSAALDPGLIDQAVGNLGSNSYDLNFIGFRF